jgi:tetratricopeptide (TPR) repeat protein
MAQQQLQAENEARAKAQAEAQRLAAEAQRQAEEARQARIRAIETAGDDAAKNGQFQIALENYQQSLSGIARYSVEDQRVRQAIINVVHSMQTPPAAPESVTRSMVRAEMRLKEGGAGAYEDAAKEMEQAVLEAPWLANAYYNLGIVKEQAGKFDEATQDFQLCLLADPRAQNTEAIKVKIYQLEVLKEDQDKLQALQGTWKEANSDWQWSLTVNDKRIVLEQMGSSNPIRIEADVQGRGLQGIWSMPAYTPSGVFHDIWSVVYWHTCTRPNETEPLTGTISDDGNSIELKFPTQEYQETLKDWMAVVDDHDPDRCQSLALLGKTDVTVKIERVH